MHKEASKKDIMGFLTQMMEYIVENMATKTDLAEAVNSVRQDLGGRIDGVENRLGGVENRLTGVEIRLDNLEDKVEIGFGRLELQMSDMRERVDRIDHRTMEDINVMSMAINEIGRRRLQTKAAGI